MEPLSEPEIEASLTALDGGWRREGDRIARDFEFENFAAAIELVNAVAALAEDAGHHPDILVHDYRYVRITLQTHTFGALSERDFALAAKIDAL